MTFDFVIDMITISLYFSLSQMLKFTFILYVAYLLAKAFYQWWSQFFDEDWTNFPQIPSYESSFLTNMPVAVDPEAEEDRLFPLDPIISSASSNDQALDNLLNAPAKATDMKPSYQEVTLREPETDPDGNEADDSQRKKKTNVQRTEPAKLATLPESSSSDEEIINKDIYKRSISKERKADTDKPENWDKTSEYYPSTTRTGE